MATHPRTCAEVVSLYTIQAKKTSTTWPSLAPTQINLIQCTHALDTVQTSRHSAQGNRSAIWAREPDFGGGYLPCSGDPVVRCPSGVLPRDLDCSVTGVGTANATSACSVFTRAGYSSDIREVVAVDPVAGTITMATGGVDQSRRVYISIGSDRGKT